MHTEAIEPNQGAIMQQEDLENIIFTIKINGKFYFTKSLKEVDIFCKEYVSQIKSPLVQGLGELFSFCYVTTDN